MPGFHEIVGSRWETSDTVAINTDWFATDLAVQSSQINKHVLQIMVPTETVVNVLVTNNGITKTLAINEGNALTAGAGYQFVLILQPGDTYNIQHATGTQNVACTIFSVFGAAV